MDEFADDCRLVLQNCTTYYGGREEGRIFVEQAERLNTVLSQQLDALYRYTKSAPGTEAKVKAIARGSPTADPIFPTPPPTFFLAVLEDLRGSNYTDKATRVSFNV